MTNTFPGTWKASPSRRSRLSQTPDGALRARRARRALQTRRPRRSRLSPVRTRSRCASPTGPGCCTCGRGQPLRGARGRARGVELLDRGAPRRTTAPRDAFRRPSQGGSPRHARRMSLLVPVSAEGRALGSVELCAPDEPFEPAEKAAAGLAASQVGLVLRAFGTGNGSELGAPTARSRSPGTRSVPRSTGAGGRRRSSASPAGRPGPRPRSCGSRRGRRARWNCRVRGADRRRWRPPRGPEPAPARARAGAARAERRRLRPSDRDLDARPAAGRSAPARLRPGEAPSAARARTARHLRRARRAGASRRRASPQDVARARALARAAHGRRPGDRRALARPHARDRGRTRVRSCSARSGWRSTSATGTACSREAGGDSGGGARRRRATARARLRARSAPRGCCTSRTRGPICGSRPSGTRSSRPASSRSLAVPLVAREEVVGLLAVYLPRGRELEPNEPALLSALASQLAVAAQNAQLHERTERLATERKEALAAEREAAKRLGALYEISRSFAQSLSLDATLEAVTSAAVELLDADAAVIRMKDERGDQLVPHAAQCRRPAPRGAAQAAPRARAVGRASFPAGGSSAWASRSSSIPRAPAGSAPRTSCSSRSSSRARPPSSSRSRPRPSSSPRSPSSRSIPSRRLGDEQVETALFVAGQAALAIDNARLYAGAEGLRGHDAALAPPARASRRSRASRSAPSTSRRRGSRSAATSTTS